MVSMQTFCIAFSISEMCAWATPVRLGELALAQIGFGAEAPQIAREDFALNLAFQAFADGRQCALSRLGNASGILRHGEIHGFELCRCLLRSHRPFFHDTSRAVLEAVLRRGTRLCCPLAAVPKKPRSLKKRFARPWVPPAAPAYLIAAMQSRAVA